MLEFLRSSTQVIRTKPSPRRPGNKMVARETGSSRGNARGARNVAHAVEDTRVRECPVRNGTAHDQRRRPLRDTFRDILAGEPSVLAGADGFCRLAKMERTGIEPVTSDLQIPDYEPRLGQIRSVNVKLCRLREVEIGYSGTRFGTRFGVPLAPGSVLDGRSVRWSWSKATSPCSLARALSILREV
jgi:hypothetical protein